ncbi:efflux ABC transporter permease/ATP-binding protein [Pavlovales sp. CCMP2436]|nr:efflux ABC transporter permease/ATP-binding protein [Pavlovales sp. CCMP2436]
MEEIAKDLAPEEAKVAADLVTVRRIWQMSGPEMKLIIPGTFLAAFGTLIGMATPYLTGKYMDVLTVSQNLDDFRHIFRLLIVFSIWSTLLNFTVGMLFAFAGMHLTQRLRNLVFRRMMYQDMEFFEKRRVGELVSRLGADSSVIQGLLTSTFITLLNNTFTLVGGMLGAFLTCWRLAAFSMIFVPLITFTSLFFGMLMRRFSLIAMDAGAKVNEIAVESIFYVHVVHMFGQHEAECARFADRIRYNIELSKRVMYIKTAFGSLTGILSTCVNLSLMYYGASLVITHQLSVGSMVAFQMYMGMGLSGYRGFAGFYQGVQGALGGSQRFFELIDRVPAVSHEGGRTLDKDEPCGGERNSIRFVDVTFAYPRRPTVKVFDGLSLHVPAGQTVALVGPSGSGKSTVARLLARVYDPQEGAVLLHGQPVSALQLDYVRSQVAWVEQEPVLFSRSVHDNVAYSRLGGASRAEVERVCRLANAHEFIVDFEHGYDTKCGERGVQISGGQKQRIAIARALLKDAPVLVLDEATSALDAQSEDLVKDALAKLLVGRTTIVIAHRLSTIASADQIVVMAQGRVVETGTHTQLMALDRFYASFVQRQVSSQREEQMVAASTAPAAAPAPAAPAAAPAVAPPAAPVGPPAEAVGIPEPGDPGRSVTSTRSPPARVLAGGVAPPAGQAELPPTVAQLTELLRQLPREQALAVLSAAGHAPSEDVL